MRFDSCCVLDHQLLEFYMLKFIDLQKHFHMFCQQGYAYSCLSIENVAGRELTVLSLVV